MRDGNVYACTHMYMYMYSVHVHSLDYSVIGGLITPVGSFILS